MKEDYDIRYHIANYTLSVNRFVLEKMGVNWQELLVMAVITISAQHKETANATTVAEATMLPRTTATRILKKLVDKGYIVRIDSHPFPTYGRNEDPVLQGMFIEVLRHTGQQMISTAEKVEQLLHKVKDAA